MMETPDEGTSVSLPNGQSMSYVSVGSGHPTLYFHGIPDCRLGALVFEEVAQRYNLHIIGIDRPGFGRSTFTRIANLNDIAASVRQLLQQLRIEQCHLIGFAMGGVHALTYAQQYPQLTDNVLLISAPALPYPVIDEAAPTFLSRQYLRLSMHITWLGQRALTVWKQRFRQFLQQPARYLASPEGTQLLSAFAEDDRSLLTHPVLLRSFREALHQDQYVIHAWHRETQLCFRSPPLTMSVAPRGRIYIWHGERDIDIPVTHAYRHAQAIPSADVTVYSGEGHFAPLMNHREDVGRLLTS